MYVRKCAPQSRQPTTLGTSIQGRNVAASCKPIYTGIHLRRTICVSKEAMERLPLSNPEGSLMACSQPYRSLMMPAQHFEPGDFTFHNRFGRAASQEFEYCEEREARSNKPVYIYLLRLDILLDCCCQVMLLYCDFAMAHVLKYQNEFMCYKRELVV
ncbi:Hypothetical_protein [Hexamita inflata]|uniref:Hypothetical_protein n=1 Tax=Hexamita inflata TaxID=28002 RepID=A0AA86RHY0_9EUKA|nr:Hypothetical protein HINF_LOCUS65855 [Hexamita inflata]